MQISAIYIVVILCKLYNRVEFGLLVLLHDRVLVALDLAFKGGYKVRKTGRGSPRTLK